MEKMKERCEISENEKWDLTRLFKKEEDYEKEIKNIEKLVNDLIKFANNINNSDDILSAVDIYEKIMEKFSVVGDYAYLDYSADVTNEKAILRANKFENFANNMNSKLSFFENEILKNSEEIIKEAIDKTEKFKMFLTKILRKKAYILSASEEKVIASLNVAVTAPYNIYETSKLADMTFDAFEYNGKKYENSFVLYENFYCYNTNSEIRRKAYQSFSEGLDKYKNTFAALYINHVMTEKAIATLRGFDSVIDYLLFKQGVDRNLYERQIDLFVEKLAPHMQKYAKLIQKFYGFDKMTFADLKVPIDAEFVPKITIEESKKYIEDGLSVLGDEYLKIAMSAYSDRWVDFANNKGKSTGGFCTSPYKKGSYILLSFTEELNEVYTLAHEIGHGVHFYYAQKNNSVLEQEPSMYYIESPSTCNELLLSDSLLKKAEDDRFKRYVYAAIIGNTYYHNCVTHLLEAAYQREVYRRVDKNEPLTEQVLTNIMKEVYSKFYGEAVEIDDFAGLTWMRQPHYYMGLYSYTYSAGLSVATEVAKNIRDEGEQGVDKWIAALSAGGSLDIVDLCKVAGVDINKDDFILNTIKYIGDTVDNIEKLM